MSATLTKEQIVAEMLSIYGAKFTDENSRRAAIESWSRQFAACIPSATGTNYTADHELYPQRIEFANGRVVEMRGQGHLFVCMKGDANDR